MPITAGRWFLTHEIFYNRLLSSLLYFFISVKWKEYVETIKEHTIKHYTCGVQKSTFTIVLFVLYKLFAMLVKLVNLCVEGSRERGSRQTSRQKKNVIGCSIWWVDQQVWYGYRDNIQKALWSLLHSYRYLHPLSDRTEHVQTTTMPTAPCPIETNHKNLSPTPFTHC